MYISLCNLFSLFPGLYVFLHIGAVFGVSRDTLLTTTAEVKERLVKWIQQGLDSGVVVPLARTKRVSKSLNNGAVNNARY